MAIDLLANPTATAPTALADYQAILTQLVANGQAFTGRLIVQGSNIKAGTVILIGGVLYKATTDTAITGTASNYVKITPSGATASAAFVANLTGVTWNDAYGGYYDGSGNLHVFDEGLAVSSGVLASAKTLIGYSSAPRTQKFTASGTFVVPAGITSVLITGCAAGGSGASGTAGTNGQTGGAGGNGGGRSQFVIKREVSVTPGASVTVTIGGSGANTSFGSSIILLPGASGSTSYGGGSGAASNGSGAAGSGSAGVFYAGLGGTGGGSAGGGGGGGGAEGPFSDSQSQSGANGTSGGGGGGSPGTGGSGKGGGGGGGGGSNAAGGTGGAGGAGGNGISPGSGGGGGGGGGGHSGGTNGPAGAGGAGGPGILIVEW